MFSQHRKITLLLWICALIAVLWIGNFLNMNVFSKFTEAHFTIGLGCKRHIQILANCPDGINLPYVNGVNVFHIPSSGTLRIKGPNPLIDSTFPASATFEDGTLIPMPTPAASQWHKGQLALIIGSFNDKVFNLFLGTREEYEREYWKLPP
jgi:hypothetical protein